MDVYIKNIVHLKLFAASFTFEHNIVVLLPNHKMPQIPLPEDRLEELCHLVFGFVPHGGAAVHLWNSLLLTLIWGIASISIEGLPVFVRVQDTVLALVVLFHLPVVTASVHQHALFQEHPAVERVYEQSERVK
jgi:hypothetical protein